MPIKADVITYWFSFKCDSLNVQLIDSAKFRSFESFFPPSPLERARMSLFLLILPLRNEI